MAARVLVALAIAAVVVAIVAIVRAAIERRDAQKPGAAGAAASRGGDGWANTPFWRWVARLAALGALVLASLQLAEISDVIWIER